MAYLSNLSHFGCEEMRRVAKRCSPGAPSERVEILLTFVGPARLFPATKASIPKPGLAAAIVPSMRINVYWLTPMSGFMFIGT